MRWSEMYPSRFLRAVDYENGQAWPLTIERVVREEVVDGEGEKPVIYFTGCQRGLILNQVNGTMLAELFGDAMDQWVGRQIILRRETCQYAGKRVPCLRLHPVPPAPLAPAPAAQANPDGPAAPLRPHTFADAGGEVGRNVPPTDCPF